MDHPGTPEPGPESPGYYVPTKDASTQTTDRDFFILEQTRDASTQVTEEELPFPEPTRDASTQTPEDDLSFLEESPATSKTARENSKRKLSDEPKTTHGSDAGKLPRTETYRISDRLVSSLSLTACRNLNFKSITATPSHTTLEGSLLLSSHPEFSNSEESYSQNEELNVSDYSGKTENFKTEEHIAFSNNNVSYKENGPRESWDTDVSKAKKIRSVEDMLAEPSTSRCGEINSLSKLCFEKHQNGSPLKQQPPVEAEEEVPRCLECQRIFSKHVEMHDGKDVYKCCLCQSIYDNFNRLQIHIYNDHKLFYCYVCQMSYSKEGSHKPGQTCGECKQNFQYKYQLEEHYNLSHKDFFKISCMVCKRKFDEHVMFRGRPKRYACCFSQCKCQFKTKFELIQHLFFHSHLKVFKCGICGNHFKQHRSAQSHIKDCLPLCKLCGGRFVNIYFLKEHNCEVQTDE